MYQIIKQIKGKLAEAGLRAYAAVIDATSDLKYIDSDLDDFKDFIVNFNATSFSILNVGDHSMPIGGQNLMFLKLSPKFMLILYTKKGKIGELLPFKKKLDEYIGPIEELIGDIDLSKVKSSIMIPSFDDDEEIGEEAESDKKVLGIYPKIKQDLIEKQKFPINDARILRFCTGENSVEFIMEQTGKTRLFVNNIIKKYQKKGFLKVIRKI